MVITKELHLDTQGHTDIQDITQQVEGALRESGLPVLWPFSALEQPAA
jgi:thiamine phosphate synthase YjbQ (UPF0047 family)